MSSGVLRVESAGMGLTIQDGGRVGWRRYGVPASGVMDDHAAEWANRLLDNPVGEPVLELLWQGAELRVLEDTWIAVTGADAEASVECWRAVRVREGEAIRFGRNRSGVWIYVAVEHGLDEPLCLGSASACPRAGIGRVLGVGSVVMRGEGRAFRLPPGVAGRVIPWSEKRDYGMTPELNVWRGPQWDWFSEAERDRFFSEPWEVSSRSDRVGYRLKGPGLGWSERELISEPVRVGTIQVPAGGEPIVTMRDGPTVGGYPKLGLVDWGDLARLAQCRPGQAVRFRRCDG